MSVRIEFFDIWQAGYGGASVAVYVAGTTTLANLFTDEALTVPAANPQTLLSFQQNGINFGKFAQPLYTASAYYLVINALNETGIIRPPLTTLEGENASKSLVKVSGASVARELEDYGAIRLEVENYGEFRPVSDPLASAATNAATLAAAIGVAAAQGGGEVLLPAGTYLFTTASLPAGVMLRGRGRGVTVLQSTTAANVITITGDRAGFSDLTLDGVNLQAGSVGIYAKARVELRIERAMVRRFETGLRFQGGHRFLFVDFHIDNCVVGMKGYGDKDSSGGADGDDFKYNHWTGGRVTHCSTAGVQLFYIDRRCWHNGFSAVGFEQNTGTALHVKGARWTDLDEGCWFADNVNDIKIEDDPTVVSSLDNKVVGFHMKGGRIGANLSFAGLCQDVMFERVAFEGGTYTLAGPSNAILTLDCTETSNVELVGTDTTKWTRARSQLADAPGSSGVTTGTAPVTAWSYDLAPGERINVEAWIVANGRNSTDYAMYHIARSAHRPGSTLNYENQTANFTTGDTITGQTSGAKARIIADTDSGTTGTLTLRDIFGEFVDDEIITGALGGSAQCNGTLTHQNAVLLGSTTAIQPAVESDAALDASFAVANDEVRINVTGLSNKTIEWTVTAKVTSG